MEERNIRVAITHGDTNGIGYEVILKAFEDPTMLELCTPIIYGSPKVATYHRNALQLETPFSIITKAEDAYEGKLNLLTTFDEEVKVEFGTPTPESAEASLTFLLPAVLPVSCHPKPLYTSSEQRYHIPQYDASQMFVSESQKGVLSVRSESYEVTGTYLVSA